MRRTLAGPGSSHGQYKATQDPGKNVPSSASGSPAEFFTKHNELNSEIPKGAPLKHVDGSADRSQPYIDKSVKVKKVDREPFLNEVSESRDLKHVDEVHDRSEPQIDSGVQVKKNDRAGFLASVEAKAQEKGYGDE